MTGLPKGWVEKTLNEVARWGSGGTPKAGTADFYGGTIPWAVIGDLTDGPVATTATQITELGLQESSAKMVPAGSVLVAMYGSIGKLGIASIPLATNQAIAFAVPHDDQVTNRYLFYYLLSQRDALSQSGKGATQQNISQTILKSWPIPVPRLDEQQRIVEILDDHFSRLDSVEGSLAHSLVACESLLISAIHRETTADLTDGGRLLQMRDLGRWVTGSTPSSSDPANQGEDVPFVTPGDVGRYGKIMAVSRRVSALGASRVRQIDGKSVQLVCIGATLGKVGWSDGMLTTNQQINSLMPDPSVADAEFVMWLLASPRMQEELWAASSSTTVPILNKGTLEQLQVRLPSIPKQREISSRIQEVADQSHRLSGELSKVQREAARLRRSLLRAAFSGQLTREFRND